MLEKSKKRRIGRGQEKKGEDRKRREREGDYYSGCRVGDCIQYTTNDEVCVCLCVCAVFRYYSTPHSSHTESTIHMSGTRTN
jgi:hypothetical protein